jgi:hypothetical protein
MAKVDGPVQSFCRYKITEIFCPVDVFCKEFDMGTDKKPVG